MNNNYINALEFFVENGISLNENQLSILKELTTTSKANSNGVIAPADYDRNPADVPASQFSSQNSGKPAGNVGSTNFNIGTGGLPKTPAQAAAVRTAQYNPNNTNAKVTNLSSTTANNNSNNNGVIAPADYDRNPADVPASQFSSQNNNNSNIGKTVGNIKSTVNNSTDKNTQNKVANALNNFISQIKQA